MNTCFVIIDCWDTTIDTVVTAICTRLNQYPTSPLVVVGHDTAPLHPLLLKYLLVRGTLNTHYVSNNIQQLINVISSRNIVRVAIMGSSWPACTHHSTFGLHALVNLQKIMSPVGIIVYPECIEMYNSATSAECTLTHNELIQTGWQPCGDFYLYTEYVESHQRLQSSQHILIAGDSWSVGEWSRQGADQPILHRGLEQYIQERTHHTVSNVGQGSSSNTAQLTRIRHYVSNSTAVDKIIWFQTDPLRDCPHLHNPTQFWQDKTNLGQFLSQAQTYLTAVYSELNQLGIPVYCIGGCWPLGDLRLYTNLIPIIPSGVEFLAGADGKPLPVRVLCAQWDLSHVPADTALVNYLSEEFDSMDRWDQLLHNTHNSHARKYFVPDSRHPNRLGHELIFDLLAQQGVFGRR